MTARLNNSALWPNPKTDPDGWALRAKRYLCALMNMHGSLFESVIDQRDVIALACIAVLKDEGNFGNKSRLMEIHAREMAARAELRDQLADQRAKEKAAVALKNEKGKQSALNTPKDPAIDKLNTSLAALAEAEQEPVGSTPTVEKPKPLFREPTEGELNAQIAAELNDTPAEDTPIPADKRYKVVLKDGSKFFGSPVFAGKYAEKYNVDRVIDTWTGEILEIAEALARHTSVTTPEPKPAANDWIDDEKKRAAFWAKARENALKRGFEVGDVEPIMHAANNVLSMRDFPGDGKAAMTTFVAELDRQVQVSESGPEFAAKQSEPPAKADEPQPKATVENSLFDGPKNGNPETALVTVPEKPKLAIVNERIQPNRFWLTSPAWQIGPFEMAKFITESGMFRNARTPAQALAIMFKGIELGVSPMAALEHINILGDGKPPSIDGALMLALLRKEGIRVKYIRRDEKACTVEMTRPDNGDSVQVTWTIEQAVKANLTTRWNKEKGQYVEQPTWKNYPQAMLTWRAVSEAARLIASDIMIFGGIPMYINEEIAPDGVYDEDGALVA